MTPQAAQINDLLTPPVLRLMEIAGQAGGEIRIVGGAVRDYLMGRKIGDIDMACSLPPEYLMQALAAAGVKAVPTGIAHGTITAVIDHVGYEITTLRRDVATDGRHAQVEFTDDWRADALRRDFTLNALYVDVLGRLYDFTEGAADAAAGRVRFIGDARERIREDVLRILRFFRFYALYGSGAPDAEGIAACRAMADLMPRLSAERVMRETLKLLTAPDPSVVWALMIDCGVVAQFVPAATDVPRLRQLVETEKACGRAPDPLRRLAALLPQDASLAAKVAADLKFSRRDGEALVALARLPALLSGHLDATSLRVLLYRHGAAFCEAALPLLSEPLEDANAIIAAWENPQFPLRGDDLIRLGYVQGAALGELLRLLENQWIASDFTLSREALIAAARDNGKNH